MLMIVTETSRLLLRYFTWDDLNDMATIYANPVVMAFRGSTRTFEQTQQLFEWMFDNYSKDGFELWAIIHKANNQLIGSCGLTNSLTNSILPRCWRHQCDLL
jgi:ribosomal-protein-alanine N-acetyltransferase